ncbi:MAG TPA: TetR/AcrR family transcriptional regulator C-terminal domain-containing protein [Polyangiaceae bacterium]|nr:TetR/AcrR family transcriptional regulator C-terminal domain-containing protein [Polyangiaceae bacterium]
MKPRATAKKTPHPRPGLSRERILGAALGLVDREGLAAVSMRRVGDELGVEATSLYNHVANKAAILDGVFEAVLAEIAAPPPACGWREALRARALALRAALRAHPNALPLFATRPAVTPASLAHVEGALEALHGAGFGVDEALSALGALAAFVVGHALSSYGLREAAAAPRPTYERLPTEAFPRVREASCVLTDHDLEAEFEFGLGTLLDGLSARLGRG